MIALKVTLTVALVGFLSTVSFVLSSRKSWTEYCALRLAAACIAAFVPCVIWTIWSLL